MTGAHPSHVVVDDRPRPGRWLTIRDIAADLGISVSTAYKWSARGAPHFPRVIRLRNREVRVRRDWYEDWLAQFEGG